MTFFKIIFASVIHATPMYCRFACPWIVFKVKGPSGEVVEFDIEVCIF